MLIGFGITVVFAAALVAVALLTPRKRKTELVKRRARWEAHRFELLRAQTFAIAERRRKALRDDLRLHCVIARSVSELVRWGDEPAQGAPQTRLKEMLVIAAVEDEALRNLARAFKQLWPAPGRRPVPESPTDTSLLDHLGGLVRTLDNHSTIVAGTEQVLLSTLAVSESHAEVMGLVIQHFGGVLPEPFQEAGGQLIHSLMATPVGGFLGMHYGEMLHGVAVHAAFRVLEHASPPIAGALMGSEILKIAGEGSASGIAEASVHQVWDAGSSGLLEAAEHIGIGHLGSIFGGLSVGDVGGAHFPLITAMIAVTREWRLLEAEKTSFDIALKNAGLDIAGSGIGAVAGAKAGAVIGTLAIPIPGVGTAIGGVVGAAGGAIAGRKLTNRAKRRALTAAIAAYEQEFATAAARLQALQATLANAVLGQYSERRKAYMRGLVPPPARETAAKEWRTVAINLRNLARVETEQARATLGTAERWKTIDRGLATNLALLGPTLDKVDAAIAETDERLAGGNYPEGSLSIVAAPIHLPPGPCATEEATLFTLVDSERKAAANWMVSVGKQFSLEKRLFDQRVRPAYDIYRMGHEEVVTSVQRRAAAVKVEKDHLGL